MKFTSIFVFLFFTTLLSSSLYAREAYIKALFADFKASPDFKSENIGRIKKGDVVEIEKEDSTWYQITFEGKKGFVTKLMVSESKPAPKVSLLGSKVDLKESARKRVSNFTSAAAARGLREGTDQFSNSRYPPNYQAFKNIELFNKEISPEKSIEFLDL